MITYTQRRAILMMIACTIFTSAGQLLWKHGVQRIQLNNLLTFFNAPIVLGFLSYGVGALLMLLAFQRGELSVLFPVIATSYVWVSLLSPRFFLTDFMNGWKWAGVLTILVSVSLLGLGRTKKVKQYD